MSAIDKIKQIQGILGVSQDGMFGPKSEGALDLAIKDAKSEFQGQGIHLVRASSFADPLDVSEFRKWFAIYKSEGMSDDAATKLAFKKGDNGEGCWGDDTTGQPAMCALPPEDMEERWGSVRDAKHKIVLVTYREQTVACRLSDRMPRRANIHNGAGIDLSPSAVEAFGLIPPIMLNNVTWRWA